MNRRLPLINLLGVLSLAVLCLFQWRMNRALNLQINHLEKGRLELVEKLEEAQQNAAASRADLEQLREQTTRIHSVHRKAETDLHTAERALAQLEAERDQLRGSVTNWARAVAERDERLGEARRQVQKLADDRNEAVLKFNEIAAKYNGIAKDLDARTAEYNRLVERFNALAKSRNGDSAH